MNYKELANNAINEIVSNISNGVYNTETDLTKDINLKYNQVFNSLVEYTIDVPEINSGDLPIVETLLNSFYSVQDSLIRAWNDLVSLGNKSNDCFNIVNSNILDLNSILNSVQNKLTNYQLSSSDSTSKFLWISDSFLNTNNINLSQTTAFIDISKGIATLKSSSLASLNSNIKSVTINKSGSIGIPGNNLEISTIQSPSSTDSANPEPKATLVGSLNNLSTISNMFDSKPDTWFEWEVNNLSLTQKCISEGASFVSDLSGNLVNILNSTNNFGWNKYIQWPGESSIDRGPEGKGYSIINTENPKNASIILNIELNSPIKVSSLEITPQTIGGVYCIVNDITVFGKDKSFSKKIVSSDKPVFLTEKLNESLQYSSSNVPEGNYSGIGIWTIDEPEISAIQITLSANGSYIPTLGFGHEFYFQVINKSETTTVLFVHFVSNTDSVVREPNSTPVISAGESGGNLSTVGTIVGGSLGGTAGALIGSAVGSLFSQTTDTSVVRQGSAYDIFAGTRSVIAIKDIDISLREYVKQSVIYSIPYYFSQPLKAVTVISTESIPSSWNTNTNWIKYELSTDGLNWKEISPENISTKNNVFYANGSNTILVRITLSSPSNNSNDTPVLMNYTLKGISQ